MLLNVTLWLTNDVALFVILCVLLINKKNYCSLLITADNLETSSRISFYFIYTAQTYAVDVVKNKWVCRQ